MKHNNYPKKDQFSPNKERICITLWDFLDHLYAVKMC